MTLERWWWSTKPSFLSTLIKSQEVNSGIDSIICRSFHLHTRSITNLMLYHCHYLSLHIIDNIVNWQRWSSKPGNHKYLMLLCYCNHLQCRSINQKPSKIFFHNHYFHKNWLCGRGQRICLEIQATTQLLLHSIKQLAQIHGVNNQPLDWYTSWTFIKRGLCTVNNWQHNVGRLDSKDKVQRRHCWPNWSMNQYQDSTPSCSFIHQVRYKGILTVVWLARVRTIRCKPY